MKTNLTIFWVLTLSLVAFPVTSQSDTGTESFRVVTDRSVYVSGEDIHYSAFNLSSTFLKDIKWSTVYYVELINPTGKSLATSKIAMDEIGGDGIIMIPKNIPTGTYYLRGYSKWMRNAGPSLFSYVSVSILNPYSDNILPIDSSSQIKLLKQGPGYMNNNAENIVFDSKSYSTREEIEFHIKDEFESKLASYCISALRKGTKEEQAFISPTVSASLPGEIKYVADTKGISISGKVINSATNETVPYAVVYISSLEKNRHFFCNFSDEDGNFNFSFPEYSGKMELFISAYHEKCADASVLIDRDFCIESIDLPSNKLEISDSLAGIFNDLTLNAQISQQYRQQSREEESRILEPQHRFFYGSPSEVIKFSDYIKLPVLEEYFTELLPHVSVRKINGRKQFRLTGTSPELGLYDPLIMIDGVAIFDVEALLEVSPRLISSIEIINSPYIRGDVTFGGLINVISINDDLGYVELPSSGLLVNYQMYTKNTGYYKSISKDPAIPDLRNTLFWKGVSETNATNNYQFFSNDIPGIYEIVIQGFKKDGSYFVSSKDFEVVK
jgi:hypothetical protein